MELLEGATVAIRSRRDGRNEHDTSESGQTLVLLVVPALLGVSGLVVDGGNWLVNRRELQNAADAAALAGASKIPSGTSQARDTANEQYCQKRAAVRLTHGQQHDLPRHRRLGDR